MHDINDIIKVPVSLSGYKTLMIKKYITEKNEI